MQPYFKFMLFVFCATLAACGPKDKTQETPTTHGMDHNHQHIYACPMHPEVQGHEGEKCSKCGMALEHMDEVPPSTAYDMKFASVPEKVEAGQPVTLSLTPVREDKPGTPVPLDVEHEKKIHLIIVSEDLSWFDHVHPEYQPDGSYTVTETFPAGGAYILFADYKPSGGTHQLDEINVEVSGTPATPKTYTTPRTTASSSPFSINLKSESGKFVSHEGIHFDGVVFKNGKPYDVNQLPSYLGAKGHMVGIHAATKTYVHLHPEVENGKLHFHTTFPEAGMYRIWLQFLEGEKLHTVDFNLMVEQGQVPATGGGAEPNKHSMHHHQHSVPED